MNFQKPEQIYIACVERLLGWRHEKCPVCSERTISLAKKITWGAKRPIVCSSCHTEFAMSHGAVVAVLLLGLAFIPILMVAVLAFPIYLFYLPEILAQLLAFAATLLAALLLFAIVFAFSSLREQPKSAQR